MSFSGYLLNGEQDSFYYMSQSRLHPQRIHTNKSFSDSAANPTQHTEPCSAGAQREEVTLESEAEALAAEADSEVRYSYFTVTQHKTLIA